MARKILKYSLKICLAATVLISLFSCEKAEPEIDMSGGNRVLLLYTAGLNDLSGDIRTNIHDLTEGYVPSPESNAVLLVFGNLASGNKVISPSLTRISRDRYGKIVKDTLMVLDPGTLAADANTLRTVLESVKEKYPGKEYGMIFSSHSTGWIPAKEKIAPEFKDSDTAPYSIGHEYEPGTTTFTYEMDLQDFARAIPMKLDFLLFDSCFMGCVEVAYQLKDKCKTVAFSPTEVLSLGFRYSTMSEHLLKYDVADLYSVCKDYYDFYSTYKQPYASISMIDCSKMEKLASACRDIYSSHRQKLDALNPNSLQCYGRSSGHKYFYDLGDIISHLVPMNSEQYDNFTAALDECIIYKAATEYFGELPIKKFCGLSSYVTNKDIYDSFYKTLDWNIATGMIM